MAKRKETISPPTKRSVADGARKLPQGSSAAGRVMADKSVAVKEGVAKRSPKKR